MPATLRIQNNGLGVQSTTIFMMAHEGLIEPLDYSIFADTQEEPEAVYQHLEWLRRVPAPVPTILVGTAGRLGDDLCKGENSTGQRFASIPAFTAIHHDARETKCTDGGMVRRQCTKEYKVEVVERIIRRDILGLKPKQRIPKGTNIIQVFGISWEERGRADRIAARFEEIKWATPSFPLIEKQMAREDCLAFLKPRVPHLVERSACVFCPFKQASEWLKTKSRPNEWARAVEIDRALREPGRVVNRNLNQSLYLHRSCVPLETIDFEALAKKEAAKKASLFDLLDCGMGMCGV